MGMMLPVVLTRYPVPTVKQIILVLVLMLLVGVSSLFYGRPYLSGALDALLFVIVLIQTKALPTDEVENRANVEPYDTTTPSGRDTKRTKSLTGK
jgi:hypothetical protein